MPDVPLSVQLGVDAGPAMDAKVAKALGLSKADWVHAGYDENGAAYCRCRSCGFTHSVGIPHGCTLIEIPPYSTDIGRAFEAAEQFGLFEKYGDMAIRYGLGSWYINRIDLPGWECWGASHELPEAICSAIITLSRERPHA